MNVIENLKREMNIPVEGRHFSSLTFLLTRQLAEDGRPNFLIHGSYLRYIFTSPGKCQ